MVDYGVIVFNGARKNLVSGCSTVIIVFMFCPPSIHITRLPTKCECFISLESITNKFMSLGNNLFAAKLKYLEGGGGCCKKKKKKG